VKVPGRLASEIARVTSLSQGKWAEARRTDASPTSCRVLAEVLRLRREEAAAWRMAGISMTRC
jgi:carboxypeptidase Taq